MSVDQIYYEIEFTFTKNFSKYSKNKEDIIKAYDKIKSEFKEYQVVNYTKRDEEIVFLNVEVPSSVLKNAGLLCYPASIEEKLLSTIEEVSEEFNLSDSK